MDTNNLKDCPFCESDDLKLCINKGSDKTVTWSYIVVHCCNCGICGPSADFDDDNQLDQFLATKNATDFWNLREAESYDITKRFCPIR